MRSIRCSVAILLAVTAVTQAEENTLTHSLVLTANTPRVEIARRSAARNYLRLPALEFDFQFTAQCAGGFSPQSMSVSIADSRKSLSAEQLANMAAAAELTITVPARQLAPIAIENFCVVPATDTGAITPPAKQAITLPAAFSAQGSLLCVYEDQQEMIYTSHSLSITLVCDSVDEETE